MKIIDIVKVTVQQPVFVDFDIPYKCEDCGYQGKPKIIGTGES